MKRALVIFMLLAGMLMVAVMAGCGGQAPPEETPPGDGEGGAVGLASPVHDCADFAELLAACPGIVMNDVQGEASQGILDSVADVAYCWIEGEPVLAQIDFTFNGHEYTYRAAVCAAAADMKDISGVYEEFQTAEELPTNDNSLSGGYYTIQRAADGAKALCTWYYEATGCQYSLWTPDGGGDGEVETVMDYLLPIR